MARGQLRIYLGAAPGVGKTYAMLQEGVRRKERGTDVVVGIVETHGREHTEAQVRDLEIVPPLDIDYRSSTFREMDLDALLARRPEVVLVDELAHTNVPGCRNAKRWQDVEELLDAGIDVISTVNIQHLESINDVVERITGVEQREIIPDSVVRAAEQVQLVDQTPEALRRRMAHGNIYPSDRADAALGNYFRVGNLTALRELALMWVANQVDDALLRYRESHDIGTPWETRERIVVALTGAPSGDDLLRRAARMAVRARGDLLGVHVRTSDGLAAADDRLAQQRALLQALGGQYHEVAGADVARALVRFAETQNATQIVLGASQRSRWTELTQGSVVNAVNRLSGEIDVHIVSNAPSSDGPAVVPERRNTPRAHRVDAISRRRRQLAWTVALLGSPLLVAILLPLDDRLGLSTELFAFLLLVVLVASVGGLGPALLAAIVSSLLANWYFTPPAHTLTIADKENLFALFSFLVVGAVVGWLVSAATQRASDAARARSEAETLAALSATQVSQDPLGIIVHQLRLAFGARAASVLRRHGADWVVEASDGDDPPQRPDDGDHTAVIDDQTLAVLAGDVGGGPRGGVDEDVFAAFTAQLSGAIERRELRAEAVHAAALREVSELRASLLAAVSHDLRTPVASIKAAASSLLQQDVEFSPAVRHELVETIEQQSDRLAGLISNLLGMSRIQSGAVKLDIGSVGYDEVVGRVLADTDLLGREVLVDVDEHLPAVRADVALLERVIANLVDNACKWSPIDQPVRVTAAVDSTRVVLHVSDRGPGIPRAARSKVFEPFQRLGDTTAVEGTGLGLAVARGFVDLMHGTLEVDDTPGGGTTMVLSMPAAGEEP